MITLCYAAKGGAGTTVVTATLALASSDTSLAVDLDGDLPTVFGLAPDDRPGVGDWLASAAPANRLDDLVVAVDDTTFVLPVGPAARPLDRSASDDPSRWNELAEWCDRWAARRGGDVVIDAGVRELPEPFVERCDQRCLVTRNCFLALDAARHRPRPDAVIVVREPGRALSVRDTSGALGAAKTIVVDWDPAVARAVDAGLLSARLPRGLRRALLPVHDGMSPVGSVA